MDKYKLQHEARLNEARVLNDVIGCLQKKTEDNEKENILLCKYLEKLDNLMIDPTQKLAQNCKVENI